MKPDPFIALAGCITGTLVFGHIGGTYQSIVAQAKREKFRWLGGDCPSNKSTVGIYVNDIARDTRSNIWVCGSIRLAQGLLLSISEAGIRVKTLPNPTTIHSLTFTSPSNGWAIGDYRYIYATNDEGRTWRKSVKTESNLTSICFIDALTGWVSGWHGNIYHTSNGGVSWSPQNSGTHYDLSTVTFADDSHGWAIGGAAIGPSSEWQSVMISTSDGGQTWSPLSPPAQLRSIVFVNASRGSGLDLKGNIYGTVDAGRTWILRYEARSNDMRSLYFLDDSIGWAAGETVLHTTDGGMTWSPTAKNKLEYSLDKVVFADPFNGWGISQYPVRLYWTMDGGDTWLPLQDDWKDRAIEEGGAKPGERPSEGSGFTLLTFDPIER